MYNFLKKIISFEKEQIDYNIYNVITVLGFKLKFLNKFDTLRRDIEISLRNCNRIIQTDISTALLHQKTFLPFKNKHLGQDIVIFASGPSASKYIPIQNAIHIGVNRAFQIKELDFDYYFIQDYSGNTQEYINELNEFKKDSCTKFYGLTNEFDYICEKTIPETHATIANALRYRTDWERVSYFIPRFAYDISTRPLGCFGSVVFPALQFALWTHPKRIYLVGCDCTNDGYAYNKNVKNYLETDKIAHAYSLFKGFAHKYYPDIEIISINPVGLKGMFKDEYV